MKSIVLAMSVALTVNLAGWAGAIVDPYPAAYAASMKDRLPVLVFVGQPAREVTGTRSISVPNFPAAAAPSVVVGVVRGEEMVRMDLAATAAAPDIQTAITSLAAPRTPEALDEVNSARAARGLRPYIRDDNLTSAATVCAEFRAARMMAGHTANDFAAVPPGGMASASGCAAWPVGMGWGSCCTYEGYTYAGAAYAMGPDGKRYMHLFVR